MTDAADRDHLDALVDRMVDRRAYHDDPTYHAQVAQLRQWMRLTEAAMRDEGLGPDVGRRVLERVAYGVPHPYEAYERMRQAQSAIPLTKDDVVVAPLGGVSPWIVDCPTCHAVIDSPCPGLGTGYAHAHARRVEVAKVAWTMLVESRTRAAEPGA